MFDATRAELLAAWERDFPVGIASGSVPDPDIWIDEPRGPGTVALTRGEEQRARMELAREWVDQAGKYGGDYSAALRELHAATDELIELERTGGSEQFIELGRGRTQTVYGPIQSGTWHPIP